MNPRLSKKELADLVQQMTDYEYILALDQSTTKVGYSLWQNGELIKYGTFSPRSHSIVDVRIHEIGFWFTGILDILEKDCEGGLDNTLFLFEDIQFQTKINGSNKYFGNHDGNVITFKVLSMLLGVLKNICVDKNLHYSIVSPSSWKSVIGVKSKYREEQKKETKNIIKEEFDLDVSEDIADAIGIGWSYIIEESQ